MNKVETVYTKEYYKIQGSENEIMVVRKFNADGCVSIYSNDCSVQRASILTEPEEGFIPATKEEFQTQSVKAVQRMLKEANLKTTIIRFK